MAIPAGAGRVRMAVGASLSAENRQAVPLGQPAPDADRRAMAVIAAAGVSLWLHQYGLVRGWFIDPLGPDRFVQIMAWAGGTIVLYLGIPAMVVIATGGRLRDHGLAWPRGEAGGPVLLLIPVAATIGLIAVSRPEFRAVYPFWRAADPLADPIRTLAFELAYGLQFVAVEFMFRGVLIHAVRHRLGAWSILFPVLPYMMIHFGKPAPEAAGALLGAIVLGYLSLTRRSIALGIALHLAIAWSVDMASLASGARP